MNDTPSGEDLPPGVSRVLNSKHGVSHMDVADLSTAEVELLRRIAAGRQDATDGDRTKAMAALVLRDDSEIDDILVRIARDAEESDDLRAMATADLGRLPPGTAQPALIDLLDTGEASVRVAAAKALGKVGGREAFEALSKHSDRDSEEVGTVGRPSTFPDSVTREVALARTLITYRLGLNGPVLPPIPGADRSGLAEREGAVRVPVEPTTDIEGILESTSGPLYGISPYSEWGARFGQPRSGLAPRALVLNADYATRSTADLTSQPGIYGVFLSGQAETGRYVVDSLLLMTPKNGELRVAELRTDGATLLIGTGETDGTGLRITLTDTRHPGTPPTRYVIRRAGDDPRLDFEEMTGLPQETPSRNPEPLER